MVKISHKVTARSIEIENLRNIVFQLFQASDQDHKSSGALVLEVQYD